MISSVGRVESVQAKVIDSSFWRNLSSEQWDLPPDLMLDIPAKKNQPMFGSQVPLLEKQINTWLVGELFESDSDKLGPFSPQVPTSSKNSLGSNRWQGSLNCPLPLYDRDHLYGGDQTMQIYGSFDQYIVTLVWFWSQVLSGWFWWLKRKHNMAFPASTGGHHRSPPKITI